MLNIPGQDLCGQDRASCLDTLSRAPAMLAALVEKIPPKRLTERRCDTCWSILEHVAHLCEVQPMLSQRIGRILTEVTPRFVPFNPAGEYRPDPGGLSALELIQAMAEERGRQVGHLSGLPEEAWSRKAVHPEYTEYGLTIVVRHMLLHDFWHMYRIEELWLLNDEFLPR